MSVHHGRVDALERFVDRLSGETTLGALDAADLMSSLVDEVIGGYYAVAERIEKEIDRLDQVALRGSETDLLVRLVEIRRRIGFVRRTLAPHRGALAALGRPEMRSESGVGEPWSGRADRLDGALSSIEALRDALLGTYDIYMGREAQRTNDVMKVLTMVSAVFLPAVVLAGIMGMNFQLPFFDESSNFFVVIGLMAIDGARARAVRPVAALAVSPPGRARQKRNETPGRRLVPCSEREGSVSLRWAMRLPRCPTPVPQQS